MNREQIIDWLLSSESSIRRQLKYDLLNEKNKSSHDEQKKISTTARGKKLLSLQVDDGKWSGQLYKSKWVQLPIR